MNYFKYDIKKHNYILFSSFQGTEDSISIWHSLYRFLRRYISACGREENKHIKYPSPHPILFLANTKNNARALRPIYNSISDEANFIDDPDEPYYFPLHRIYADSWLFSYKSIWLYLNSNARERAVIRRFFETFFTTIGLMKQAKRLLTHFSPRMVVMANDHSVIQKCFITLAGENSTDTMYLQHCSVTERFPALQFTYSFLDGEESWDKYRNIGETKGTIYVSGSPRFDCLAEYKREKTESNKLGLAINEEDNEELVKNLCLRLHESGIEEIVLRPHPRQTLHETAWYKAHNIEISDSKTENPFEYLGRIKMLIASESGIHLDAAMMGVYSICYSLTGRKAIDWYSYIKNGLVPNAETTEELLELLQPEHVTPIEKLQEKAQWYNASYGRETNGHVGEMVADLLRHYLDGSIAEFDRKYGFVVKEQTENYTIKVYDK